MGLKQVLPSYGSTEFNLYSPTGVAGRLGVAVAARRLCRRRRTLCTLCTLGRRRRSLRRPHGDTRRERVRHDVAAHVTFEKKILRNQEIP